MATGYIRLESEGMQKLFLRFEEATEKTIPQIVRSYARVCAVELANRTQLFSVGGGKGKLAEYTGYLKKDLLKITKDREALDKKADSIADTKLRARLKVVIASGDIPAIAAMLVAVGTIKSISDFQQVTGSSEFSAIHKSHRSSRTGRALSTRPRYHYAPGGIDSFVTPVAARLGYVKSGWAECAREIGGVKGDGARGIPAFAKRHKGENFKVTDQSNQKSKPYFTMHNTTPWVSRLLPASQQAEAANNAKVRMVKYMQTALTKIAENKESMQSITDQALAGAET